MILHKYVLEIFCELNIFCTKVVAQQGSIHTLDLLRKSSKTRYHDLQTYFNNTVKLSKEKRANDFVSSVSKHVEQI